MARGKHARVSNDAPQQWQAKPQPQQAAHQQAAREQAAHQQAAREQIAPQQSAGEGTVSLQAAYRHNVAQDAVPAVVPKPLPTTTTTKPTNPYARENYSKATKGAYGKHGGMDKTVAANQPRRTPRRFNMGRADRGYQDAPQYIPGQTDHIAYSKAQADAYARAADASAAAASAKAPKPKKPLTAKRVLGRVAVCLAALLVIAGGAAAIFVHLINVEMHDGVDMDALDKVLVQEDRSKPYYILLLGSDSREGVEGSDADWAGKAQDGSDGLTDVMILARIDEPNHQVTMLSIPRDTPYQTETGEWLKMNWAYRVGNGAPGAVKEISKFTGVPISHVVELHMSGLMDLVDTLGGITVDVPVAIDYHEALTNQEVHLDAGVQRLNGVQTEVFARERLVYGDGQEGVRQSNVRAIVEAIMAEVANKRLVQLPAVIAQGARCFETDYAVQEGVSVLTSMGRNFTLYNGTGPTAGDYNPYITTHGDWFCYEDPEGWSRVLDVFVNGGDPSTVSYENDKVWPAGSEGNTSTAQNGASTAQGGAQAA